MTNFLAKPLIFILSIAITLIGIELQSADAQWVQRRICENGVCRTVLVPATVKTFPRVFQSAPVVRSPLWLDVVQPQQPIIQPPIRDIPSFESLMVSPLDDMQAQAIEALKVGDRQFIRTVRDATTKARQAGKLTALQQARILAAVRLPNVGKEVEQLMAAELDVPMSATGLIDWENFDPEKFLKLIEGILKILLVFGIGA